MQLGRLKHYKNMVSKWSDDAMCAARQHDSLPLIKDVRGDKVSVKRTAEERQAFEKKLFPKKRFLSRVSSSEEKRFAERCFTEGGSSWIEQSRREGQ